MFENCYGIFRGVTVREGRKRKKEEEGSEKKEIKGMKLTLTHFNVVFVTP